MVFVSHIGGDRILIAQQIPCAKVFEILLILLFIVVIGVNPRDTVPFTHSRVLSGVKRTLKSLKSLDRKT